MIDLSLCAKWIYETLSGDATITGIMSTRIYRDAAPQGAIMPCIVFQLQSPGNDLNGVGGRRIYNASQWTVKAIAQGGEYSGNLNTLATRIDALLHDKHSAVGSDGQVWCVRLRPFQMPEIDNGIQYRHSGGVYEITAQVY